jgi:hypothetical protein
MGGWLYGSNGNDFLRRDLGAQPVRTYDQNIAFKAVQFADIDLDGIFRAYGSGENMA